MAATFNQLVKKYNRPIPRYTSYPTVPVWQQSVDVNDWTETFQRQFKIHNTDGGLCIYMHLPFCESLCTYCGCNKKITTNHSVEERYILALQQEWQLYKDLMNDIPVIREIHLGGGTPTFFSATNLQRIVNIILSGSRIHPAHQFSIEGHPNNTTFEQLKTLYDLGFRRISYGVQDNDPTVQKIINRIQPFENVERATTMARQLGFTSINFDLIYGLPRQTLSSIAKTIEQVATLRPDRIAFYSYAHVPWTSKAQRLFDENDLPANDEKIALYLKGKELLTREGYIDIGMDHFALPHDELVLARDNGTLHRNFMGYTTQRAGMLIALGVSAISDANEAYVQNEKNLHDYYLAVEAKRLPVKKGYFLTEEDKTFRKHIIDLACLGTTKFRREGEERLKEFCFPALRELEVDGLVTFDKRQCSITQTGHHFIRNICSAFDLHLQMKTTEREKPVFSMSI